MRTSDATKNESARVNHSLTRDATFGRGAEIKEMLLKVIDKFHQKGATSPDKAITVDAREFPPNFKELMKGRLGELNIFVEVNGRYYLSEKRLQEMRAHIEAIVTTRLQEWDVKTDEHI